MLPFILDHIPLYIPLRLYNEKYIYCQHCCLKKLINKKKKKIVRFVYNAIDIFSFLSSGGSNILVLRSVELILNLLVARLLCLLK